jgi:hypothetical protein
VDRAVDGDDRERHGGIRALSYAGQLTLSVVADPDPFPDLPVLLSGLPDQLTPLGVIPRARFHEQEKFSTA